MSQIITDLQDKLFNGAFNIQKKYNLKAGICDWCMRYYYDVDKLRVFHIRGKPITVFHKYDCGYNTLSHIVICKTCFTKSIHLFINNTWVPCRCKKHITVI